MNERTNGIGIDLGTSNSAICRMDASSATPHFEHAFDLSGEREIPSAVFIDLDGSMSYGQLATQRQVNPDFAPRVFHSFKKLLRENQPLAVEGVGEISPMELAYGFLGHLKRCYEMRFDICDRAVITVPANQRYDFDYKTRIRQVVTGFGEKDPLFTSVETLEEPDAVIRSLIELEDLFDKTVLVFDMGGGTLDVSIRHVEVRGDDIHLSHLAVDGSDDAGGRITDALGSEILDRWERQAGFSFTDEERTNTVRFNHYAIDSTKRRLSAITHRDGLDARRTVNCQILVPSRAPHSVDVPAVTLTDISRPVCEGARSTVEKALAEAGILPSEVDVYFMVGGSSLLPLMKSMLTDFFDGRPPTASIGTFASVDPLTAVSKGAAYQDFIRVDNSGSVPDTVPTLERKLPYSISMLVNQRRETTLLVPSGESLPHGPVRQTFYLPDRDESVDIVLCRGEGNPKQCAPVSTRTLYFGSEKPKGWRFEMTLYINEDGEVTIAGRGEDDSPIGVITGLQIPPGDSYVQLSDDENEGAGDANG